MGIEGRFAAPAAPSVPIVSLLSAYRFCPRSFEKESMMKVRMTVGGVDTESTSDGMGRN